MTATDLTDKLFQGVEWARAHGLTIRTGSFGDNQGDVGSEPITTCCPLTAAWLQARDEIVTYAELYDQEEIESYLAELLGVPKEIIHGFWDGLDRAAHDVHKPWHPEPPLVQEGFDLGQQFYYALKEKGWIE
jgi:hypothetical protein